ncbi:GntR family transcriptional regulator [Bacillus massiliigorillae]|uniref:GntR family transcriptional regulator n=1 Tax=Bacillus massiliigorillae TaxID=1243664 RepID=UPI0003A1770D|nr:GntR family transcriptional regulator [Bacillus massiliigorillae]
MSIKQDHRHLYLQVIEKIKQDIKDGVYIEKEKLPSEFVLSKQLGVSRATLREALRILEEENVIIRRHGVGTFINAKPLFSSGIEQLYSVTSMIEQAGMKPGTIFLSSTTQLVSEDEMHLFNCKEKETLNVIERLRTANDEPVVYCLDKMLEKDLPDNFGYHGESIFNVLERNANMKVAYAVSYIEPLGYHEKISPLLQCDPETALLVLKQMHYDENDRPILYSLNYFKSNKFSFHVLRKRM